MKSLKHTNTFLYTVIANDYYVVSPEKYKHKNILYPFLYFICTYVSVYSKEDTIIRTIKHTHTLEFSKRLMGSFTGFIWDFIYGIFRRVYFAICWPLLVSAIGGDGGGGHALCVARCDNFTLNYY